MDYIATILLKLHAIGLFNHMFKILSAYPLPIPYSFIAAACPNLLCVWCAHDQAWSDNIQSNY